MANGKVKIVLILGGLSVITQKKKKKTSKITSQNSAVIKGTLKKAQEESFLVVRILKAKGISEVEISMENCKYF